MIFDQLFIFYVIFNLLLLIIHIFKWYISIRPNGISYSPKRTIFWVDSPKRSTPSVITLVYKQLKYVRDITMNKHGNTLDNIEVTPPNICGMNMPH
jgi:hypothetical protein